MHSIYDSLLFAVWTTFGIYFAGYCALIYYRPVNIISDPVILDNVFYSMLMLFIVSIIITILRPTPIRHEY